MEVNTHQFERNSLPAGIVFVAKRNKKDRFFLASKVNSFGGWNVEAVLVDSGCNSILLPILVGQLDRLLDVFPVKTHRWRASTSNGVNGRGITLNVRHFAIDFQTTLCHDMQNPETPCSLNLPMLRFHLCLDDAAQLVPSHPLFAALSTEGQSSISSFVQSSTSSNRRIHALVGQSLLSNDSIFTIQHRGIKAAFITTLFPTIDIRQIQDLDSFIVSTPDHFDDLEDEEHVGDEAVTLYRDYDTELLIG
jgi:hypothetical protein